MAIAAWGNERPPELRGPSLAKLCLDVSPSCSPVEWEDCWSRDRIDLGRVNRNGRDLRNSLQSDFRDRYNCSRIHIVRTWTYIRASNTELKVQAPNPFVLIGGSNQSSGDFFVCE